MKLTPTSKSNNITTHRKSSAGRGNPFSKGFNKPQILIAVFLCSSFLHSSLLSCVIHIMMVLFGQSLGLVAPLRGISTPLNTVTNIVENTGDGYPTQSKGITS